MIQGQGPGASAGPQVEALGVWTCPRCWHLGSGAELAGESRSSMCSWCQDRVGTDPPAEVLVAIERSRAA